MNVTVVLSVSLLLQWFCQRHYCHGCYSGFVSISTVMAVTVVLSALLLSWLLQWFCQHCYCHGCYSGFVIVIIVVAVTVVLSPS